MRSIEFPELEESKVIEPFGIHLNGSKVNCYTLQNENGIEMKVLNFGATIQSLKIPIENGTKVDVVLGFDSLEQYVESYQFPSPPYFGAIVGRFAGRINQAKFKLNRTEINLSKNLGQNHLHGGKIGFSQAIWSLQMLSKNAIILEYLSQENEENYPGSLKTRVSYSLTEQNELKVEIWATSSEDTLVNLTQHSYFNLDGHSEDIVNQLVSIESDKILETNILNIPTGNFVPLENHPFNFSSPKACPQKIDHTFVLNTKGSEQAVLISQKNKLKMMVSTNQPAIHIYVGGNCFNLVDGKNGENYHALSGICFEAQNFPDAPNHPHFPNAILKKGEVYNHQTTFKFESLK